MKHSYYVTPFWGKQGDQKIGKEYLPNFSKSSQNSHQAKKIYIKAQYETLRHLHQTTLETLKFLQQTMF